MSQNKGVWVVAAVTLALSGGLLGGCTHQEYAKLVVQQDTSYGRLNEVVLPSGDDLVKSKVISAARVYTMADKACIDVWVMHATVQPPRGTVLVLHGLCDSKAGYLPLGKQLAQRGFDVVLPDLRAHGRSGGKYVTFGALERQDMKMVMDRLAAEKLISCPIYVWGTSLGGSIAILYAADDPSVAGVMAMSPYKDLRSVIRPMLFRVAPLMNDQDYNATVKAAGRLADFDPTATSTLAAVAKLHCPLLLVHGKLDSFVPFGDSEALFQAATGPKELQLLDLDGHFSLMLGREGRVVAGIEKIASPNFVSKSTPTVESQQTKETSGQACSILPTQPAPASQAAPVK